MLADFHIHTYFSDGRQSPEDVARAAAVAGLSVISVCDHNSTATYDRLRPTCASAGIALVQGVELDVYWRDKRLHLLGYNFDPQNAELCALIVNNRRELDQMSVELVRAMAADYPALSMADYERYTYDPRTGGWKGVNYLKDRGVTDDLLDGMPFYKQYAGDFHPGFSSMEAACLAIQNAGGLPVLAHPGCAWPEVSEELSDALGEMKALGLAGIECYYPDHVREMTEFLASFCRRNDMRITCGGDGHGGFGEVYGLPRRDIGVMRTNMDELDLRGIFDYREVL